MTFEAYRPPPGVDEAGPGAEQEDPRDGVHNAWRCQWDDGEERQEPPKPEVGPLVKERQNAAYAHAYEHRAAGEPERIAEHTKRSGAVVGVPIVPDGQIVDPEVEVRRVNRAKAVHGHECEGHHDEGADEGGERPER